jgi:hypothetical protein
VAQLGKQYRASLTAQGKYLDGQLTDLHNIQARGEIIPQDKIDDMTGAAGYVPGGNKQSATIIEHNKGLIELEQAKYVVGGVQKFAQDHPDPFYTPIIQKLQKTIYHDPAEFGNLLTLNRPPPITIPYSPQASIDEQAQARALATDSNLGVNLIKQKLTAPEMQAVRAYAKERAGYLSSAGIDDDPFFTNQQSKAITDYIRKLPTSIEKSQAWSNIPLFSNPVDVVQNSRGATTHDLTLAAFPQNPQYGDIIQNQKVLKEAAKDKNKTAVANGNLELLTNPTLQSIQQSGTSLMHQMYKDLVEGIQNTLIIGGQVGGLQLPASTMLWGESATNTEGHNAILSHVLHQAGVNLAISQPLLIPHNIQGQTVQAAKVSAVANQYAPIAYQTAWVPKRPPGDLEGDWAGPLRSSTFTALTGLPNVGRDEEAWNDYVQAGGYTADAYNRSAYIANYGRGKYVVRNGIGEIMHYMNKDGSKGNPMIGKITDLERAYDEKDAQTFLRQNTSW